MLSGLLVTSCGYTVGGPLIGAHFDNEKGFFERVDIVLQNDEFMGKQRWSAARTVAGRVASLATSLDLPEPLEEATSLWVATVLSESLDQATLDRISQAAIPPPLS